MLLGHSVRCMLFMSHLVEEKIYGQVIEELESVTRRKSLWEKALQKSRSNEQKAKVLYVEYRVQSIKDEAVIARTLAEEHSDNIIQSYLSKVEKQEPEIKQRLHDIPNNLMAQKYHEKKCYKCRKVVSLAVKPCPTCHCNSFVFCG